MVGAVAPVSRASSPILRSIGQSSPVHLTLKLLEELSLRHSFETESFEIDFGSGSSDQTVFSRSANGRSVGERRNDDAGVDQVRRARHRGARHLPLLAVLPLWQVLPIRR